MRHRGPWLALAVFLAAAGSARASDTILVTGGTITTNADGGAAEALVARGGWITFVGSAAQAKAHAPEARVVDLKGGFAYPGFVDSHAHLLGIGFREMTLDLGGVRSLKELQTALGVHAAQHPTGPITGRGWIETHWPEARFPTRKDIDAVVDDRRRPCGGREHEGARARRHLAHDAQSRRRADRA